MTKCEKVKDVGQGGQWVKQEDGSDPSPPSGPARTWSIRQALRGKRLQILIISFSVLLFQLGGHPHPFFFLFFFVIFVVTRLTGESFSRFHCHDKLMITCGCACVYRMNASCSNTWKSIHWFRRCFVITHLINVTVIYSACLFLANKNSDIKVPNTSDLCHRSEWTFRNKTLKTHWKN